MVSSGESGVLLPLSPGDNVCDDRFGLVRERGKGGTAITFVARDNLTDEEVALKIAKGATLTDKKLFLDQYRKLIRLNSKWLPAYLGYFEHSLNDGPHPVICLELIGGQSLGAYLTISADRRCLDVMRELAEALDSLDAAGARHGDITTDNVIVRDGHPVLIDPDSGGQASAESSFSGSDFRAFVSVVGKSKIAVSFPTLFVTLTKIDSNLRPFRAAESILREPRPTANNREPSARLDRLANIYKRQAADAQAAFASLLAMRRDTYLKLCADIDMACTRVGIVRRAVDNSVEEKDHQEELSRIGFAVGTLKPCERQYSAHSGLTWTLHLSSKDSFSTSSVYQDPRTIGEISSTVHAHDSSLIFEETLRIRRREANGICEILRGSAWIELPDSWSIRTIEILIGERIPVLAATLVIPGDKNPPIAADRTPLMREASGSDDNDDHDAVVEDTGLSAVKHMLAAAFLEDRSSSDGFIVSSVPRTQWKESALKLLNSRIAPKLGEHFHLIHRFDLTHDEERWLFEIEATHNDGTHIEWQFDMSSLDDNR